MSKTPLIGKCKFLSDNQKDGHLKRILKRQ